MSRPITIKIKRLASGVDLPLPALATEHAAGADLRAAVNSPVVIQPGEIRLIPCGFAICNLRFANTSQAALFHSQIENRNSQICLSDLWTIQACYVVSLSCCCAARGFFFFWRWEVFMRMIGLATRFIPPPPCRMR